MARSGRRPGHNATREDILAAARTQFAELGYDATTIRGIAAEAGVNPALIHHFFGAKEKVFVAALALPVDPTDIAATVIEGPREEAGRRLVELFLSVWESSEMRSPFLALLRSAASNEDAARMLREFLQRSILSRVGAGLGVPELRLTAVGSQLMGMALFRYVIKIEPMASATEEEVVDMIAPVLQQHFDA